MQEGILITIIGISIGLGIGFLLCFAQIKFGLIKLGGESGAFIVPYYPVQMKLLDFLAVFGIVFIIGISAAWYPVQRITSKYLQLRISDFLKSQ